MSETTAPTLLRADFEAWLVGKGRGFVGERAACDACPIAQWLTECGFDNVDVRLSRFTWNGGFPSADLPTWACAFISRVDTGRGRITARVALRILRSLPQ
jgi:hypothetical protein